MPPPKKLYTPAERIRICNEVAQGFSMKEVLRRYDLHCITLYNWKRNYREQVDPLVFMKLHEARGEAYRLRQENEKLKAMLTKHSQP